MSLQSWLQFRKARLHLLLNRQDEAAAAYRAALDADPDSALTAASLGFLEASRERYAEAVAALQSAVRADPSNADYWFNLGYAQQQRRDLEAALNSFRRAVELKPSLDRAWFGMGLVQRDRSEQAQAAESFRKAAELQPMNPHAFYELAKAHFSLNHLDEVDRIIQRVAGFDPEMTRQLVRETGRHPEGVRLR